MSLRQPSLFDAPELIPGLSYRTDQLAPPEEADLVARFADLPFRAFEFRQYRGLRRIVSFGWRYDFSVERLQPADPIPDFLAPLRTRAAALAGQAPEAFVQAMVTEYAPGAGIGWHKDKAVFDKVAGVSLLAPCRFRFRRRAATGWERAAFTAEPRSIYVLDGEARRDWEHSIPALEQLRYSITFRSMKPGV